MKKRLTIRLTILLLVLIFATACGGNPTTPSIDAVTPDLEGLPPVAAIKAREVLAAELDLGIEEVAILSQEQKIWSDSCLGLGGAAESCLQAEVDGWSVELSVNGETYKARTDWLGEQVRFEP
ncbi:MAG: hypothetical protein ACK2U1_19675 [Anaerolineales bacterium]